MRSFLTDTCVQFNWDGYKEGARRTGLSWTENHWRWRATKRKKKTDFRPGEWVVSKDCLQAGFVDSFFLLT